MQSKRCGEVLHFGGRQCLSEDVGHHVVSRAIDKAYGALLDDPADPMITHIDVLGPWMVLMITRECDGGLVIGKESGGVCEIAKHLRDEAAKPKGFLATMRCCDVLTLGGGQRNNLLSL